MSVYSAGRYRLYSEADAAKLERNPFAEMNHTLRYTFETYIAVAGTAVTVFRVAPDWSAEPIQFVTEIEPPREVQQPRARQQQQHQQQRQGKQERRSRCIVS